MDVVILLVFCSLLLVCGGIVLLVYCLRQGDFEHAERLSLLPLADDSPEQPSQAEASNEPVSKTRG